VVNAAAEAAWPDGNDVLRGIRTSRRPIAISSAGRSRLVSGLTT
jgi:hypothetical protein